MNKELIDRAWACLPREFKEEVKYEYNKTKTKKIKKECDLGFLNAHEGMFGVHNLTSDAEGEEMLIVSRKRVQDLYSSYCNERDEEEPGSNRSSLGGRIAMLQELFGSKCLPDGAKDEAKKSFEPKFHLGDKVRIVDDSRHGQKYRGDVTEIVYVDESDPDDTYKVDIYDKEYGGGLWYSESDLEPYTEPTANYMHSEGDLNTAVLTDKCSSASTCDKQFDKTLADSFRNERRLNIAAQFMSAMMSNPAIFHQHLNAEEEDYILYGSLEFADRLLAEEDKKGGAE